MNEGYMNFICKQCRAAPKKMSAEKAEMATDGHFGEMSRFRDL